MAQDESVRKNYGANTLLAHTGNDPRAFHGFVNPPVVHASTVLFPDAETMEKRAQRYTYGTRGTPTTEALADAISELEGAEGTIVVPSGLAAVTVPMLAFLNAGDHVLIVDSVYFPTRHFADTMLTRLGVDVTYYDPALGTDIATEMRSNTKVVLTEAPGSNTFEMQDIPAVAKAARAAGAVVMMDNTWATPLFFKPLDHGVDISINAATKYPGGHSDVLLGTVAANARCWPQLKDTMLALGVCAAPDDCYAVLKGLRTMGIRLERHQKTALSLASKLEHHEAVARVLHPALKSFPGHDIFQRDFCGSSGLFSIVLRANAPSEFKPKAHAFLNALQIFGLGYSWGGYESLAVHANLGDRTVATPPADGPVLRLQIGIEDEKDLLADLERGLAAAAAA